MPTDLIRIKQDSLLISGEMTFATAPQLWKASQAIFPALPAWNCDFSEVTACDSAGLALLLEWIKLAKQQKRQLRFQNIPKQLQSMAAAAGLEKLLLAYYL